MKKLFFFLLCAFFAQAFHGQQNKGLCSVEVNDVSRMTSFGYLVSYVVQFKNYNKKTVDGIYWRALFYNNNGDFIKSEESSFNSTNLIDPIASGFTKSVTRAPGIKGASKVVIVIRKVHFSDRSRCN